MTKPQENAAYVLLVALQTAAASFLFWVVFPLFRQMIDRLGERQSVSLSIEVKIVLATLVLNGAYWARYRSISIPVPFYSPFVGHAIQFASRISFFFGGALFSALFFRHLPELDTFPTMAEALTKGLIVIWVLFALFCYSLELDRLGKAIEEAPKPLSPLDRPSTPYQPGE